MSRLLFFASSTLILACSLAYPTRELVETTDASPADSAVDSRKTDSGLIVPGPCKPPGEYCGQDKVSGDPNTLYRCVADADAVVIEKCEAGCVIAPPGTDDYCR